MNEMPWQTEQPPKQEQTAVSKKEPAIEQTQSEVNKKGPALEQERPK